MRNYVFLLKNDDIVHSLDIIMEQLEIKATAETPQINFDPQSGEMMIKGRAIPQDAEAFWAPVLKWFYAYAAAPQKHTSFVLDMEYFNISTSKQLLFFLHKLNELKEDGYNVSVIWKYTEGDIEMRESGNDYSCMVDIPFQFVEKSSPIARAV